MGKRQNYTSYTRPHIPEKTKWELYLEELGLKDETAVRALRDGTGAASGIRAWIRANCTRTFIPEMVLGVLGGEMVFAEALKSQEEIW